MCICFPSHKRTHTRTVFLFRSTCVFINISIIDAYDVVAPVSFPFCCNSTVSHAHTIYTWQTTSSREKVKRFTQYYGNYLTIFLSFNRNIYAFNDYILTTHKMQAKRPLVGSNCHNKNINIRPCTRVVWMSSIHHLTITIRAFFTFFIRTKYIQDRPKRRNHQPWTDTD